MKTILYLCHSEPDETGTNISSEKHFLDIIDQIAAGRSAFCELFSENGYALSIGIRESFGCAQHNKQDWDPPYLVATTAEAQQRGDGEIVFFYQEEYTPMALRHCLPLELIKKVAVHFLNTGERSDAVEWESV